jgi:hypothetical protein
MLRHQENAELDSVNLDALRNYIYHYLEQETFIETMFEMLPTLTVSSRRVGKSRVLSEKRLGPWTNLTFIKRRCP